MKAITDRPFQRARQPEHRRQRRHEIVKAAGALAAAKGVRNVTLIDIAEVVGLADSTVVRQFGARDEIFLELSKYEWDTFADDTIARLEASGSMGGPELAELLARSWADHPLFCDLIGQSPTILERHASPEKAVDFKLTAIAAVGRLAQKISAVYPNLDATAAASLIGASSNLVGGYWALARPGPSMLAAYEAHPEYAHYAIDFLPTIRHLLEALIVGLPRVPAPNLGWVEAARQLGATADSVPGPRGRGIGTS